MLSIGKLIRLAGLGLVALSISGVAFAGNITLKFAGVLPIEHYAHKMMEQIKSDIEAANVGIKVKLFPAGQLGSGEELLEDTIRGNIDMVHAFVYAHKDPVLEINSLPFLVSSWDELVKVYGSKDSAYTAIMTETLAKLKLKLLGNVAEGFIGVVSTKKPNDHAGLGPKGIHIRVWGSKVAKDTTEAIGFKTTTMNWAEVFAAVQAGTVDGAICCTPQAAYTVFAQSQIGKYYIPYNAFVEASTYYASQKTWKKLNDEQKSTVQAAIDRAAASFTNWARDNDAGYIQKLKDAGYEVLDLTDAERGALSKHIKDNVWPQVEKVVGKDIVDRLKADM